MLLSRYRAIIVAVGALLPLVVVLSLAAFFEAPVTVEKAFTSASKGPDLLSSISADANQICLAVIAATALLFREPANRSESVGFWVVGAVTLAAATGAIFSGFAYRVALGRQLSTINTHSNSVMFNPTQISERLTLQASLVVIAFSCLLTLVLLTYLPRHRDEGEPK